MKMIVHTTFNGKLNFINLDGFEICVNGNCKKCEIIKYSKYTCAGCYRQDFKPMNWELREDV